jgi:hypothetical protein
VTDDSRDAGHTPDFRHRQTVLRSQIRILANAEAMFAALAARSVEPARRSRCSARLAEIAGRRELLVSLERSLDAGDDPPPDGTPDGTPDGPPAAEPLPGDSQPRDAGE